MLRGQINLWKRVRKRFDRLKYFGESKLLQRKEIKKRQKAIVVPYLDATMIVDFPKSM